MGLGSAVPNIDVVALIMCYMFLRGGAVSSAVFAMGLGLVADIYSGGGHGIFLLSYLFALGGILVAAIFLDLYHPKGQIFVVFLAVLIRRLGLVPGLEAFSSGQSLPEGYITMSVAASVLSGLLAPFGFYLLDKLKTSISGEMAGES
ncbi:MAG: hypothetical protein C4582_10405 [Desulfobacteraceae bacterium]|jgi:rod shape-determining protein MreD|nr:MAG: hypothetical protein C4582_10405 [Desulfobacteraceae bacterium]